MIVQYYVQRSSASNQQNLHQSTQLNTEIPILQGLLVYEYTKRKHNIDVGIMRYAWIARFLVQNVEVCRHIFLVRLIMDWYVCPCPYVCECSPTISLTSYTCQQSFLVPHCIHYFSCKLFESYMLNLDCDDRCTYPTKKPYQWFQPVDCFQKHC